VKNQTPPSLRIFSAAQLTGPDRESFAQRLLSRDIKKLPPNLPKLCLLLAAQAKLLSYFWIERRSDALRLYGIEAELQGLREKLEFYKFTEEVAWEVGSDLTASLHESESVGWHPLELRFKESGGSPYLSEAEWLEMRVQRMLPLRDWDFDSSHNVFELGLTDACDENKGCYIGQEVVERVRSRAGRPSRHLAQTHFESEIQELEELSVETEKVGSLTKSVVKTTTGYLALSWMDRKFCQVGIKVRAKLSNKIGVITKILEGPKRPKT